MSTEPVIFRRGEIWLVNFDLTIGAEIRKQRPAIIVSSDAVGRLPIKLIAPITGWKEAFANNLWHVRIEPTPANGLAKVSAMDALQLRGVDKRRFISRLGRVTTAEMREIIAAIAVVVEYSQ